jgi:predicted heme/steroid binding protein
VVPATEVPATDAPAAAEEAGEEALLLTLEELKAFDGKEGRRAYVAVDGIIFDVTDSPLWASGTHNGNQAGQDLTQALAGAPHGPEKLENVVEIGVLVE